MVDFVIPVMLDYSANAIIYGETAPSLTFDYTFSDVSGVGSLTLAQIQNTFKYKDTDVDASGPLLKYDTTTGISATTWHTLLTDNDLTVGAPYRNAVANAGTAKMGEHVIRWIASTLFGHPLAQAPISNDQLIVDNVNATTGEFMGKQLYDALNADGAGAATEADGSTNNLVLLSMFEQLVQAGRYTDNSGAGDASGNSPADTNGYVSFPYKAGDRISFLVKIGANCENHDPVYSTTLNTAITGAATDLSGVFGPVDGVTGTANGISLEEQVWKFNFLIAE